jgi:hypothetical protein
LRRNKVAVDVRQLERQIEKVEGIIVGLTDRQSRLHKPYPTRPSPGSMTGREWLIEFTRMYPDLDVEFPAEHLTLSQLRVRHAP